MKLHVTVSLVISFEVNRVEPIQLRNYATTELHLVAVKKNACRKDSGSVISQSIVDSLYLGDSLTLNKYSIFDSVENDDLLVRTEENSQNNNNVITTTVTDINMNKKREAFIIDDGPVHLVTNKFSNQVVPRTMMRKCIPVECTSSPIVDILASTAVDHPKPPSNFKVGIGRMKKSTAVQCDRRINLVKDKRKSKFIESPSREEKNQDGVKSGNEKGITLLEKIIRTHPIWYLQHIGRSAATHLLRPMNEGAFIVRSSSKPNAMALSIRSPPGLTSDIDHYLIESAGPDRSVRVESSPYQFKSLPLLIEHYCLNGEELQTNLVLPVAVTRCCTSMQLQSLALMGQG
ncbi:unnamed protein product [Acanthocheilonema viteae]|uniref:SH2 domain-containing protein n=1 Tax=Acanthocheilonema viteae TaxID=6277 RepID=A0A498SBR9_ACAVI|nr:unnamed protein product [Acanthocheilonema viteae]